MRLLKQVFIHCSDSEWGNAKIIDEWHKSNGWDGIGYHYVINNCYPTSDTFKHHFPVVGNDGRIEVGRDIEKAGAHARGYNENSVGICLIGEDSFTSSQLNSLATLIAYRYPDLEIKAHYEVSGKTCPNIDIEVIKELVDLKRL